MHLASSGVICFSVSANDGDTDSVSCDAVASSPAHISCSVSSSSIELASTMGNSNRVGTAFAGKPASWRIRSVFRSVLTRFFARYGFMLSEIIAPMSSHTGPVNLWTRSAALLTVSLRSLMSIPHLLTVISATRRTMPTAPHLKNNVSHHQIEGAPSLDFETWKT